MQLQYDLHRLALYFWQRLYYYFIVSNIILKVLLYYLFCRRQFTEVQDFKEMSTKHFPGSIYIKRWQLWLPYLSNFSIDFILFLGYASSGSMKLITARTIKFYFEYLRAAIRELLQRRVSLSFPYSLLSSTIVKKTSYYVKPCPLDLLILSA